MTAATFLPRDRWRRALALSPAALLRATAGKLERAVTRAAQRRRDGRAATYAESPGSLARRLDRIDAAALPADDGLLREAARRHCDNRFDLLGSGWVALDHGVARAGLEGVRFPPGPPIEADAGGRWLEGRVTPANLPAAQAAWRLVEPPYRPIDWQCDIRSGYRWSARDWYADVPVLPARGADIKLPWELGRMQHLALLALGYRLAQRAGDAAEAAACRRAFRNHVLDFIAANPPRFGAQWWSSMEVALRATSFVLALDLFRAAGAAFDTPFLDLLAASVLAHVRHVRGNLERGALGRANHYLCNVAGLAVAAAYLPATVEARQLRAFAAAEVAAELHHQFLPDGGHFEASTGYHRLCTEAMLYAVAVGGGEVEPLARAVGLTRAVTKPSGLAWQVGDADSGRFAKLWPTLRAGADGPREVPLDHRHLVSAASGDGWEGAVLRALSGGRTVAPAPAPNAAFGADRWPSLEQGWQAAGPSRRRLIAVDLPAGAADGLACHAYPDTGLYVWRGPRLFLGFRCGAFAHDGSGAHAHNDQLAVELWIDGEDVWADPGSFVYTPLPEERDCYRSAAAHRVPRPAGAGEPSPLDLGIFRLPDTARARCLAFGAAGAAGEHHGFGFTVCRAVRLLPDRLDVRDWVPAGAGGPAAIQWLDPEPVPFSPGYGLR